MTTDSSRWIPRSRLVELLAPTVGLEKSQALVDEAAAALGIGNLPMSPDQARKLLEQVSKKGGVVGAAARLASARLEVSGVHSRPQAVDLVTQLAPAIGHDRASEQVATSCKRLGLDPGRLDREGALRVLEQLGGEAGITGVTARFVKARLLLSA